MVFVLYIKSVRSQLNRVFDDMNHSIYSALAYTYTIFIFYIRFMETTILHIIGWYYILVGGAVLVRRDSFVKTLRAMMDNDAVLLMTSIFTLILCLIILAFHNTRDWSVNVIITIMGWAGLIKALSMLYFPSHLKKTTEMFLGKNVAYVWGSIVVVLGVVVLYLSWM